MEWIHVSDRVGVDRKISSNILTHDAKSGEHFYLGIFDRNHHFVHTHMTIIFTVLCQQIVKYL